MARRKVADEELFKYAPFELLRNFLALMTGKKFDIFRLVCERPGISIAEITRELGLPKSTVSSAIAAMREQRLVETRIVVDEKSKRVRVRVYPNVETLSLVTKELEILYLKARRSRLEQ
ncbi:MAG: MarR family transcriptional regulator [bacterium]|nr:MarR family transcriptional regulator [bacterium]